MHFCDIRAYTCTARLLVVVPTTYLLRAYYDFIYRSKPKPYMPGLYGVVRIPFNCNVIAFTAEVRLSQTRIWWYTHICIRCCISPVVCVRTMMPDT